LRLLSFSPSARSASSATRVALQSRSRSLSLSERTEKPPFGGLFLLRNGHRPVRNPASPVFSPAPGPIRTARNGLSAVGRYGHGRTSRLPRRTLWVRFRFQSGVQGRAPLRPLDVCAVRRRRVPVGASPPGKRSSRKQPGAVMEVTKWLKPLDSGSRLGDLRECAGRNASERRANLEKDNAQADPTGLSGKADMAG